MWFDFIVGCLLKMYCEWASLQGEIQCDKANQSVLHKFPETVGRDVAFTVVKSIAQNLSVVSNSCEPSHLTSDKEVKWTMEVTKLVLILYCKSSFNSWFGFMVFNTTFNNILVISWRSVLLLEETGKTRRKPHMITATTAPSFNGKHYWFINIPNVLKWIRVIPC